MLEDLRSLEARILCWKNQYKNTFPLLAWISRCSFDQVSNSPVRFGNALANANHVEILFLNSTQCLNSPRNIRTCILRVFVAQYLELFRIQNHPSKIAFRINVIVSINSKLNAHAGGSTGSCAVGSTYSHADCIIVDRETVR